MECVSVCMRKCIQARGCACVCLNNDVLLSTPSALCPHVGLCVCVCVSVFSFSVVSEVQANCCAQVCLTISGEAFCVAECECVCVFVTLLVSCNLVSSSVYTWCTFRWMLAATRNGWMRFAPPPCSSPFFTTDSIQNIFVYRSSA